MSLGPPRAVAWTRCSRLIWRGFACRVACAFRGIRVAYARGEEGKDAVEEMGLVSLREAVAVGARLEVLVIKSGLAAGSLDMVAPLAQSLRRLSLERCPKVVGKLPSALVIVAPRCMLSATVRLTKVPLCSQLHSGDIGVLAALVNLTDFSLSGCDNIFGKEHSCTLRLGL